MRLLEDAQVQLAAMAPALAGFLASSERALPDALSRLRALSERARRLEEPGAPAGHADHDDDTLTTVAQLHAVAWRALQEARVALCALAAGGGPSDLPELAAEARLGAARLRGARELLVRALGEVARRVSRLSARLSGSSPEAERLAALGGSGIFVGVERGMEGALRALCDRQAGERRASPPEELGEAAELRREVARLSARLAAAAEETRVLARSEVSLSLLADDAHAQCSAAQRIEVSARLRAATRAPTGGELSAAALGPPRRRRVAPRSRSGAISPSRAA